MSTQHYPNSNASFLPEQNFEKSTSTRDDFSRWAFDGNAKKLSPQATVACLDKVSEYLVGNKISCSVWELLKPSLYKTVYQIVLDSKMFRITERDTYKIFIVAGKVYLKFLKERPWKNSSPSLEIDTEKGQLFRQSKFGKEYSLEQSINVRVQEEKFESKTKDGNVKNGVYNSSRSIHNSIIEINQSRVKHLLNTKFENGYRTSSSIDFERFKNFYSDEYNEEFSEGANSLNRMIKCVAVVFDDRAYVYDDAIIHAVRSFLEQLDFPCVYINVFFEKFSNELYAFGIFSIDMLKAFIERYFPEVTCKWDYIYLEQDISTSSLIRDVFNERESWSVKDLYNRLPCLKQDTVRAAINSADYLRIDTGVYTHIDNMDLPENHGEKVLQFVNEKLQNRNYVIANEIDLSEFERLNPHCPFSAIRDAVFNKFLSKDFSKSGQVITKLGEKIRVLDVLEQYCHDAQTVSFGELNSLEASFDPKGQSHSACLIAAHNVMVRVSDELFVAESKINFEIYKTDEAIALYCREDFVPLKNVTDFSLFPYAGYPWNLYLLESYVRKFSNIFKYDVRAVNSANIGVVVRKSFRYSEYDNIISIALAKSTLNLSSKKEIGDFLFNSGYIGRRNFGNNEEKILDVAKKIREGGGL